MIIINFSSAPSIWTPETGSMTLFSAQSIVNEVDALLDNLALVLSVISVLNTSTGDPRVFM